MAWASARCKAQAALRNALLRTSQEGVSAPSPPHPSTQLLAVWWAVLTNAVVPRCATLCRAALRTAAHRSAPQLTEALVTGGHPHHLLQAHEPSGCNPHRSASPRTSACRCAYRRGLQQ